MLNITIGHLEKMLEGVIVGYRKLPVSRPNCYLYPNPFIKMHHKYHEYAYP